MMLLALPDLNEQGESDMAKSFPTTNAANLLLKKISEYPFIATGEIYFTIPNLIK